MSAPRSSKRRAQPARYPGKVLVQDCGLLFRLVFRLDDGTELAMTTTRTTRGEAEEAARRIEGAWNFYQSRRSRIPARHKPHARPEFIIGCIPRPRKIPRRDSPTNPI